MTQASHGLRPRTRPDKALHHAELGDFARVTGVWSLHDFVVECGREEAWVELLDLIRQGKEELPNEQTGPEAALRLLTTLFAFHRCGGTGYRGVIAPQDQIAAKVAELTTGFRGCSVSTVRGAERILEKAGLIEPRGRAGRGRAVYLGGDRWKRKGVTVLTLTVVATSFWSGPSRRISRVSPPSPTPTDSDGKPIGLRSSFAAAETRPRVDDRSEPSGTDWKEEPADSAAGKWTRPREAPPPATFEHGRCVGEVSPRTGPDGPGAPRGKPPPPSRRYGWRPRPDEPNNWGNAVQAILYDVETALIRDGRPDRDKVLEQLRRELSPNRALGQVAGLCGAAKGSGLPWGDLLWRWRGLPLEDRRILCSRSVLPAVRGHVRRLEIWETPPDRTFIPPRGAVGITGPRARPSPPPAPAIPTPKNPTEAFLAELPSWLAERMRRRLE